MNGTALYTKRYGQANTIERYCCYQLFFVNLLEQQQLNELKPLINYNGANQ